MEKPSVREIARLLSGSSGSELRRLVELYRDDEREGVRAALKSALGREAARKTETTRLRSLYGLEADLREQGYTLIAGVDEVGRGALAGPLSAGACILPPAPRIPGLNDSKQLTAARREEIAEQLKAVAVSWSVAHISAEEIDALGMTAALRRVIGRALAGLYPDPDHVVLDGRPLHVHQAETAVVKGDAKVAAVAAASILAKVTRDALMCELAAVHPHFSFEVNKGYGTHEHMSAISVHGLCAIHRRSFTPGGGTLPLL